MDFENISDSVALHMTQYPTHKSFVAAEEPPEDQAAAQGEGAAGQTLTTLEHYPLIGDAVQQMGKNLPQGLSTLGTRLLLMGAAGVRGAGAEGAIPANAEAAAMAKLRPEIEAEFRAARGPLEAAKTPVKTGGQSGYMRDVEAGTAQAPPNPPGTLAISGKGSPMIETTPGSRTRDIPEEDLHKAYEENTKAQAEVQYLENLLSKVAEKKPGEGPGAAASGGGEFSKGKWKNMTQEEIEAKLGLPARRTTPAAPFVKFEGTTSSLSGEGKVGVTQAPSFR